MEASALEGKMRALNVLLEVRRPCCFYLNGII